MFGFKGKPSYNLQLEGYGQLHSGLYRFFGFGVCHKSANYATKTRFIYDTDESGPDPVLISKSALGQTAYDGTEVYPTNVVSTGTLSGGGIAGGFTYDSGESYFRYNNTWEGVWMNGTATLTPATRKSLVVINRMDYISDLTLLVINSAGTTATSNLANQPVTFDFRGFTYLKGFYLSTGYWNANVTFKFPEGFTHFYFTGFNTTTINGTLPASTKMIQIGAIVTSVTTLIQNASACEILTFGHPAGGYNGLTLATTTLSGALDISHMTSLKIFMLNGQSAMTSLVLPTSTNWKWLHILSLAAAARPSFNSTPVLDAMAATNANIVYFANNGVTVNQNINNSNIGSNLQVLAIMGNTWTGDVTLTTSKPNLKEFRLGQSTTHTGLQLNTHPIVDISGLTGARLVDIAGCNISTLSLPANTVMTTLSVLDNALTRYYQKYINTNITSGWAAVLGAANITYSSDGDGNYVEIETTATLPTLVAGPSGSSAVTGRYYRITWKYKAVTDPYGGALRSGGQTSEFGVDVPGIETVNTLYTKSETYQAVSNALFSPTVVLQLSSNSVAGEKIRIYEVIIEEDLISQINALTALTTLRFAVSNTITAGSTGQSSTAGMGANPSFANLTALTVLEAANCKFTGNMTLPTSTNTLTTFSVMGNTGLTGFTNYNNHKDSLTEVRALDCDAMNFDISQMTNYSRILISKWLNTTIDISGRTSIAQMNSAGGIYITQCPNLTTIVLPASNTNFTLAGSQSVEFSSNPNLTTVTNISSIKMSSLLGQSLNLSSNALNIVIPFSTDLLPSFINLQNNGMSQANLDTTIDNWYTVRASFVSSAKSANIAGTNAAASGTYQAPAGFVLGSNDGTPASAKEKLYVLVNNYNWSITMN